MKRALDAGDRLAVFVEASVWADAIRDAVAFEDSAAERSPPPRGFPDMERRRDWHYVNQPLGESSAQVRRGRLHEAIPLLQGWLGDRRSPYRSYALVWLLHLLADLHQPLHVSTRRLADGSDDAGGNEVEVLIDGSLLSDRKRGRSRNLHAYWDELAAPPWLSGKRLAQLSERLMREYPPRRGPVDLPAWRAESFVLAGNAYRGVEAGGRRIRVGVGDHQENRRLAEGLVTLAGYRLADLLDATLGGGIGSTETGARNNRMPGEEFLHRQSTTAGALQ